MTRLPAILTTAAVVTAAFTATADAKPLPERLAPGGNLTSVVKATERDGWPHPPTREETRDVARLALWHAGLIRNRGERVAVLCRFNGWTIGRARCGVQYARGKRRTAFALDVKVWEDGGYRFDRRAF